MDLKKIIQQIKKGNQEAFQQLVEYYQTYAFRLAFKIVCNEEDAKDIVQDSFIKIWKNIKQYKQSVKFSTWLYKIVTNTAIDLYRSKERKPTVPINEILVFTDRLENDNPENKLINRELGALFQRLADDLSEKQRLVFILRDLQGNSSKEVQDILEMSEDAVKSNLYLARRSISEKLITLKVYERS